MSRQHRGLAWWGRVAALVAAPPVLMGWYAWSCVTPVQGIFPSGCHPLGPVCSARMAVLDTTDLADVTEDLLVDTEATSMLSLNHWNDLERCAAVTNPVQPAGPPSRVNVPCDVTGPAQAPDGAPDAENCNCYYSFLDPATHPFIPSLEKFVSHTKCSGADGRSAMIQLGPVFTFSRAVPAYLFDKKFDDVEMIDAFKNLWDKMSEVLKRDDFKAPPGGSLPDRVEWIISIGNEINFYLDDPDPIDGDRVQAWQAYATFYKQASEYVLGQPAIAGTPVMSGLGGFARWVTFNTTWRRCGDARSGCNSIDCSPGWQLHLAGTLQQSECYGVRPEAAFKAYTTMMGGAYAASYTLYPNSYPPGTSDPDVTNPFYWEEQLGIDFAAMQHASETAKSAGSTSTPRPIVLQELGYPSSYVDPFAVGSLGPLDCGNTSVVTPGSHNCDNIADQQVAFVTGAYLALNAHNNQNPSFGSELTFWGKFFLNPGQLDWNESPWAQARIVSFNAFMLHDFWNVTSPSPGDCPFTYVDPFVPGGFGPYPTALGLRLCSLGLRDQTGAPKPAWTAFRSAARAINGPALVPDRACSEISAGPPPGAGPQ